MQNWNILLSIVIMHKQVGLVTTCQTVTFMYSCIKESQELHLDPEDLKLLNLYYFFFVFLPIIS